MQLVAVQPGIISWGFTAGLRRVDRSVARPRYHHSLQPGVPVLQAVFDRSPSRSVRLPLYVHRPADEQLAQRQACLKRSPWIAVQLVRLIATARQLTSRLAKWRARE